MNYLLSMLICSTVATTCLPPYTFENIYDSSYTCLVDGYQKSIDKLEEIGQSEVDKHGLYLKFECTQLVIPKKKPIGQPISSSLYTSFHSIFDPWSYSKD